MAKRLPLVPHSKLEHFITLSTGLLVLIGGLLAVAAWQGGPGQADIPLSPTPTAAPAPTGPLSGWTILVDPGHGGYDGGARARTSGMWEKHLNLSVAQQVRASLAARGATVLMTREDDTDLCEADRPAALTKKRQDMQNRVAMAVDGGADMVLSIHMNEYRAASESGPQVFYRAGCDSGRLLAGCMQESLITHLKPKKQRAAMAGDYYILRLEIPSVLVECGFISNPAEEALLLDANYQARIGEAVAEGVVTFAALPGSEKAPGS